VPAGPEARFVSASLIVTAGLPLQSWTEAMDSERLTGALLDRLTHRVHILEANGESYRLREAKSRRESGCSVCTGRSYASDLRLFRQFLEREYGRVAVGDITTPMVRSWIVEMKGNCAGAPASSLPQPAICPRWPVPAASSRTRRPRPATSIRPRRCHSRERTACAPSAPAARPSRLLSGACGRGAAERSTRSDTSRARPHPSSACPG
jgi:hypothetical protein